MTTETVLSSDERDKFVGDLIDYGTEFVAPLYAVVESIEQAVLQSPEVSDMNGAIRAAIFLLAGDATNTEYVRGMCELLAMLFAAPDMDTAERAEWFETKIHGAIDAAMKEQP